MKYFFMPILVSMFISTNCLATMTDNYQLAVIKTSLHQPTKHAAQLITIQGPTVRMVTYATGNNFKTNIHSLNKDTWTTVEPELKQLCNQFVRKHKNNVSHEQLSLWLAQMLGLPSDDASERRFVILDVPVIQAYYGIPASNIGIFRPCTDPRIGPHTDQSPICPSQMNANDPYISTDYKTWFINTSITSYTMKNGAPWTEYGYTYNWNDKSQSVIGLSEFVALKDTPVTVIANPHNPSSPYISAEEYCSLS